MNLNKKLTSMEIINLILSIFLLIFSFITSNNNLIYGGASLLLASIVSILFIKLSPFYFEKFEINILQIHIFICIVLGTTLNFYSYIHEFDFYLHIIFGLVASILSIPFIKYFLNKSNLNIKNIPISFMIFIIFCFSSTCGILWELYEFSVDTLFKLNTQNASLFDTMTDIIANTTGIITFCIIYFLKNKKQAK